MLRVVDHGVEALATLGNGQLLAEQALYPLGGDNAAVEVTGDVGRDVMVERDFVAPVAGVGRAFDEHSARVTDHRHDAVRHDVACTRGVIAPPKLLDRPVARRLVRAGLPLFVLEPCKARQYILRRALLPAMHSETATISDPLVEMPREKDVVAVLMDAQCDHSPQPPARVADPRVA